MPDVDVVGIDKGRLAQVIGNIDDIETRLKIWFDDLEDLKTRVVQDWYGDAPDQFDASYTALSEKMMCLIDATDAVEAYAMDSDTTYTSFDRSATDAMNF
ncbi:MAG: WXG100 family type VII secretion target [Butyrivibrio sp.]|jgi:uncharacterized protein YukE|nr:WXG100 family type VII secretion target [Butyrivibrio sp.]MCR4635053.1 WXG100 family type VII secretion target [Butyrivibrio sp.]